MASDSCSILIAGCDYTDEWLSEPLSLLCSSSFFLLVGVEVGFPFQSILLPPARRFRHGDSGGPRMKEKTLLWLGEEKKWAGEEISAKVENKPSLLEVRCAFCVAMKDGDGDCEEKKEREGQSNWNRRVLQQQACVSISGTATAGGRLLRVCLCVSCTVEERRRGHMPRLFQWESDWQQR